ncbi:hypothetical protein SORBI_3005G036350 [Sorghum bicolor]|uniref:Uncharacterized protein n=1 Tax=Sorghum bicolor TaxID=4558 RepID=A0A1Z5RGJ6_SORBI|nr:hypothetical protein SORBI_3005G036350 [Sorghum bicolor]
MRNHSGLLLEWKHSHLFSIHAETQQTVVYGYQREIKASVISPKASCCYYYLLATGISKQDALKWYHFRKAFETNRIFCSGD